MALSQPQAVLTVPGKTTEDVGWTALHEHIRRVYAMDPDTFLEAFQTLHRMRQARGAPSPAGDAACAAAADAPVPNPAPRVPQAMRTASRDMAGRDHVVRYYQQLELLELRFPLGKEVNVPFTW